MSEPAAESKAAPNVVDIKKANASGNGANHGALREVSAKIIEVRKANGATSSSAAPEPSEALPEEPWSALSQQGKIIEPPFDMLTLSMLCEHNSELNQCIEAMEVNIEGFGYRFIPRLKKDAVDPTVVAEGQSESTNKAAGGDPTPPAREAQAPKEVAESQAEFARISNFFMYCTDESFVQFRRKCRRDLEATGNAYFEVIRNQTGEIQAFTHMPSYQMRLGRLDDEAMLVDRKIVELQPDGSVAVKKVKEWKRFRRFAQSRAVYGRSLQAVLGTKIRWFKQFGDPRKMDKHTGEYKEDVKPGDEANEVMHLRIYCSRSPYGLPRFIGNLLSIFGDRASEEINYITFRNNNIPSMVVCVSNGQLTQGTIDRIQSFVESQIQGSDNYSKFLIVEGEPFGEEGEDGGQVKIDIKPLTTNQHKDALFQEYSKNNQDKVRRAFRLPPIFVGRADDYSRATAEASRRIADEQVFAPERDEWDALVNRVVFPEMDVIYHKFKSNSPNTTDNAELVKILAGAEKTGGMTPRIARHVLAEVLNQDLPEFPQGFPADTPFSLTMAEAVKNMADPAEPGQQVTAIKTLKAMGFLGDDNEFQLGIDENTPRDEVAKKLTALNAMVTKMWQDQGGELE
jgi:PBSX family phage portal protein